MRPSQAAVRGVASGGSPRWSGPCVAGIDLGTTGVKVGVFGADGRCLALAAREQRLLFPAPGRVEQSPEATWQLQCEAVREAVATAGVAGDDVVAVALSVQRGTAIALDAAGRALGNHVVWMDRRGLGQLERLRSMVGADRYYDLAGHPLVPYTGVSKVLWFRHEAPALFARCRVVAPPQTYHLLRLGAADPVCDTSTGTFFFPFDLERFDWNETMLALADVPADWLPRVVASTAVVGTVAPGPAAETGLSTRTRLVAGGGDGQCAAVGSGVIAPGLVMVNVGTAAGVQTFLSRPLRDPRRVLNCAAHAVPGAWEMEGHTQASGAVLRWMRDHLWRADAGGDRPASGPAEAGGRSAYDAMTEEAARSPAGARGLLLLPTFNGASAPVDRPDFRGALLGLTLAHDRADVLRAILEGVSLEIRWMLDAIREVGVPVEEVRLVGGGSVSPAWNRIHADVLQVPLTVLDLPDAAVTGAAVCAAVGAGLYADVPAACRAFVPPGRAWTPDPGRAALYGELSATYRRAFEALDSAQVFPALAGLGA